MWGQCHRALTSNSRLAFALLPKEKEVFTKLVRDGHQTGSKQAWWDPAMAKCRHCPADAKDDLCHVFYGCVMFPALYWACALEIFNDVLINTNETLRVSSEEYQQSRHSAVPLGGGHHWRPCTPLLDTLPAYIDKGNMVLLHRAQVWR